MFHDQRIPNPQGIRLDVLIPLFASRGERAEQKHCPFIANKNVRSILDNLRRTAHGFVLLLKTRTREAEQKQKPPASAATISVEISRYEFPRHIEPVAGSRHLTNLLAGCRIGLTDRSLMLGGL